jgi:hypothetical protein
MRKQMAIADIMMVLAVGFWTFTSVIETTASVRSIVRVATTMSLPSSSVGQTMMGSFFLIGV